MTKARKIAGFIIFLLFLTACAAFLHSWWTRRYTPPRTPEQVMGDTLHVDKWEIKPEDMPVVGMHSPLTFQIAIGPRPDWKGSVVWDNRFNTTSVTFHGKIVASAKGDSAWKIIDSEGLQAFKENWLADREKRLAKGRENL